MAGMADGDAAALRLEVEEGVATLTLCRPEKRNALDTRLIGCLMDAFSALAERSDVLAVVLAGAGKVFCAGADLTEFRDADASAAVALADVRTQRLMTLAEQLDRFPKPLVAAVEGAAVGAGARLAMAADAVFIGRGATLSFPELPIGRLPVLLAEPLVRAVGYRHAFSLLVGEQILDGEAAMALGLAQAVTDAGAALSHARDAARAMARLDPALVQASKTLMKKAR